MTGYYDIVLGLIPVSLAGLTALLFVAGMSLSVSIALASVATLGVMAHAMFVRAPVGPTATEDAQQSSADSTSGGAYTAD
jgi:Cu/Ag efflux pump CusA